MNADDVKMQQVYVLKIPRNMCVHFSGMAMRSLINIFVLDNETIQIYS